MSEAARRCAVKHQLPNDEKLHKHSMYHQYSSFQGSRLSPHISPNLQATWREQLTKEPQRATEDSHHWISGPTLP